MSRSEETRLLIAACRGGGARQAPEVPLGGLDWPRLIERAVRLGVAGHLRSFVESHDGRVDVPPAALARLEAVYYEQAAGNALLHAALRDLLAAFRDAGMSIVVLKGAALAEMVYGNLALRPMRDLDLLVREGDVPAAEAVLRRLEYVADESFRPRSWYVEQHHHLPPFLARDGPAVVEIHWQLAPAFVPVAVPVSELWERAGMAEVAGTRALVLAPDDLVVHLALHLAGSDGFVGKLGDLCDIAATIRRYGPAVEWDRLAETARRSGAAGHVYYALWVARALLDADVPNPVLGALEASARRGLVVDRMIKRFASWAALASGDRRRLIRPGVLRECGRALLHVPTWRGRLRAVARTLYEGGA